MSKFCRNCGTELPNDSVSFCTKCGANQNMSVSGSQPVVNNPHPQQNVYVRQNEISVSTGEWIGWILLCSFLPIIGQIIMLCAANNNTVKNYAKANLIITIISIVLVFVVIILFIIAGISFAGMSGIIY